MIHTSLLCTSYACNSRLYFPYLTTSFTGKQWHLKTEVNSQNTEVWQTVIWKKQCINLFTYAIAASDNCFEKAVSAEDISHSSEKAYFSDSRVEKLSHYLTEKF